MHLDSYKYLVSVSEPLQLTLQTPLAHESQMVLGMALQSQLEVYRSHGFQPVRVYVDLPWKLLLVLAKHLVAYCVA
jgi:hypothetical protein